MNSSETNEILCDIDDGVATITLNRPEVMNAFSDAMRPALREALREMGAREDVGCIVITRQRQGVLRRRRHRLHDGAAGCE